MRNNSVDMLSIYVRIGVGLGAAFWLTCFLGSWLDDHASTHVGHIVAKALIVAGLMAGSAGFVIGVRHFRTPLGKLAVGLGSAAATGIVCLTLILVRRLLDG